jgi:hypothetical protein
MGKEEKKPYDFFLFSKVLFVDGKGRRWDDRRGQGGWA